MMSWSRYVHEISDTRRKKAANNGETPPDIKGSSNYERAALRESAHRDSKVTLKEKWIGRVLFCGTPIIILTVFLATRAF